MAKKPRCYLKGFKVQEMKTFDMDYVQYKAFTMILRDYSIPVPRWLKQSSFNLTDLRRDFLLTILDEAGLGENWCQLKIEPTGDDYDFLHAVWHTITYSPPRRGKRNADD